LPRGGGNPEQPHRDRIRAVWPGSWRGRFFARAVQLTLHAEAYPKPSCQPFDREETPVFPINDALDVILLGTFLFGLMFTVGSLLIGIADLGIDHGGLDHTPGDHGLLNLFNVSSLLAFITWFGGVGYLARNGLGWHWSISLALAIVGGVAAGWLVLWFVRKVLRSPQEALDPRDFERVGVLARVTSSIREGGVGEIVWELRGSRMVTSARSAGAMPIARGTEVLILRVERGMAIVEPFDDLLEGSTSSAANNGARTEGNPHTVG
jgi:membrane protein implicated in regulation of membrane protease activity